MKKPRKCANCRKAEPMWGHAVCKECLPRVKMRKPIDETIAMIDDAVDEWQKFHLSLGR